MSLRGALGEEWFSKDGLWWHHSGYYRWGVWRGIGILLVRADRAAQGGIFPEDMEKICGEAVQLNWWFEWNDSEGEEHLPFEEAKKLVERWEDNR